MSGPEGGGLPTARPVVEDHWAGAPPAGQPGAIRRRLPYLRATFVASAALLVVGVPLGFWLRGATGAAGVAAGVALVVLSYLISGVSVAWADAVHPRLIMSVGLVTYVTKIVILGVAMSAVAATGWAGLAPMGVAIIAAVVVWTVTQLVWTVRAPLPYVQVDAGRVAVRRCVVDGPRQRKPLR